MADAPIYMQWFNDPDVTRFVLIALPYTLPAEEEVLRDFCQQKPDHLVLGIRLKDTMQLIGNCSLFRIDSIHRCATLGIVIGDKQQWSKGYGTEATQMLVDVGFRTLNLNRIDLDVHDFNARAIQCYEKIGFVKEGELRQAVWMGDRYYNTVRMGILRDEWFQLQPEPVCKTE
jgi:RimJ/RimL family protein N-acetyltransferase